MNHYIKIICSYQELRVKSPETQVNTLERNRYVTLSEQRFADQS